MRNIFCIMIAVFILSLSTNVFAQNGIGAILENNSSSSTGTDKKPEYTASPALTEILLNQSVVVLSINSGGCSGTIIYENKDDHYVLTAKHCISVSEEMYVEHNKVLYIIASANDDLAILVVDGLIPGKKVAKISKWKLFLYETAYHIGYPSGILYKSSGKVVRDSDDWQYYDFTVIRGCSGGGIFNKDGELAGVIWGGNLEAKEEAPLKSVGESLYDIESFLRLVLPEALK